MSPLSSGNGKGRGNSERQPVVFEKPLMRIDGRFRLAAPVDIDKHVTDPIS